MTKQFCAYCGKPLADHCTCEQDIAEASEQLIEDIEERQHQSGFYAFQDLMAMRRFER